MLMGTKQILGYKILATNGEIGQVSDFLVDGTFKLRYLVIDTGKWLLPRKRVALPTAWISSVDPEQQLMLINLDRKQIEEGPEYWDEHVLVPKDEARLHDHYGRPPQ